MDRTDRIRSDFDEIARLAESGASGRDLYDGFLLSQIPSGARRILDVGCGLGRLTWALASRDRQIIAVDLSPAMVARAKLAGSSDGVTFCAGDFLQLDLAGASFDCIVSAAALHHMEQDAALARMAALLSPGGRLVVHDLRCNRGLQDRAQGCLALARVALRRFIRTGRPRPPRRVREVWARHGASERYLSLEEARGLAGRLLPGAHVVNHWLWRYTIVWDKPTTA
jgi:2-polyprenyl-3-methyl-5-hydroxy-6-metoxy-1,4-benzoquinol methylase